MPGSSLQQPVEQPRRLGRQHCYGKIHRDKPGTRVSGLKLARFPGRAAARVEDPPRRNLQIVEALQHAYADLGLEARGFGVSRRGPLEAAARRARIKLWKALFQWRQTPRAAAGRCRRWPKPST